MLQTCARGTQRLSRPCLPIVFLSAKAMRKFSQSSRTCSFEQSALPPSEKFQLLKPEKKVGREEDLLFDQQVQDVKEWWASPRYEGIIRPYSPADVVSKRGSLQQRYPSSVMARKLFDLLKAKAAAGEPVHTSASTQNDERDEPGT